MRIAPLTLATTSHSVVAVYSVAEAGTVSTVKTAVAVVTADTVDSVRAGPTPAKGSPKVVPASMATLIDYNGCPRH
jgi:hypothetical protein